MDLKQRLMEGVMVGVVGGLVATAIGGVGVLAYSEMKNSREQLEKTTVATQKLNASSNTSIDRMTIVNESISSLIERVYKLEEENKIIYKVNSSNSEAIKLISEALKRAAFTDKSEVSDKIKQAAIVTRESSKELERLTEITADREIRRTEQQQQQILLEKYQNIQQQQQQQQQPMW